MDNRIRHMSHPDHMLVFSDQWTEQQKPLDCKVCSKPISPGTPYYICEDTTDCKFTLHQSCSKLPGKIATLESETEQKLEAEEKAVNENDQDTNPAAKSGDFGTEENDDKKNGETSNVEVSDGESKRGDIVQHLPLPSNKVEGEGGNNLVSTKPAAENKIKLPPPKMMQKFKLNQNDDDEFDDDEFDDDESDDESMKKTDTRFSDLGGIRSVLEELKKEVMVRLNNPLLLRNLGVKPVSGVLLHGPPGCGKTKLAHAIAHETALPFHYISSTKLNSSFSSGPKKLQELFEEAHRTAPSIVFIDEIDKLVKPWNQSLMTQLLTCMDEPNSTSSDSTLGYVFVIGATNKPAALGPDLRKPGRFDREIFIGFPDENARVEILSVLTRNLSLKGSVDLVKLSRLTPRFVGGDLEKLVHKARSLAINRIINQRKFEMSIDSKSEEHIDEWWKQPSWVPKPEETENLCIDMADFEVAAKIIQPASTTNFVPDGPRFSDFGGISSVLEELKMDVMVPRNNPFLLRNLGVKPVSGILLHGPPGCGKTKLAHAIANETALPFHYISSTELVSDESSSGQKTIQRRFEEAYRTAPSIVCIDEIDAIALKREDQKSKRNRQLVTQLLTCMDESNLRSYSTTSYVIVIGTTNRLDALDPDFRRPGRFDHDIAIGVPDENARVEILSALTRNLNLDGSVDLVKLSRSTPRFVGADLATLVNKVGKIALKRIINKRKSKLSRDSKSEKHIDEWKQPQWLPKPEEMENLCIVMADFEEAVKMIKPSSVKISIPDGPTFRDMGGISSVLEELKMEVIVRLNNPLLLRNLGIKPVSGILLHGPPGCGKTKLAHAIANETALPFHYISSAKILSDESSSAQKKIQFCFAEAYRTAPSIVFIDEIDAIASKKEDWISESDRELLTLLLTYMDESNFKSSDSMHGFVIVIGATNRPDALDPEFRRPGRFDREIVIDVPDENARVEILSVLTRNKCLEGSVDLVKLSRSTPRFVGADLAALVDKAGNHALKRIIDQRKSELSRDSKSEEHIDKWWKQPHWLPKVEETENLCIHMADFEEAAKTIQPSRDKELSAIPAVTWEDVGGLDLLRQEFDRYIIQRIKHPEEYEEFGIDLDTGVLLHGPPGCGKTLIAKAVANEAGANFIHIKGPELLSKYVGKSEQTIRNIFSKARKCSPCIIFFDEVDSLTASREEMIHHYNDTILNQLLVELDGGDNRKGIFVIGATNRPEMMDAAVLRPGRLGKSMRVPLPDADGRASILKALSRKKPVDASVDFHAIARMKACENLTGAHLAALINEAAMAAMNEKLNSSKSCSNSTTPLIKTTHFEQALPSISRFILDKSILRERELSSIPDVKWEDVGGLDLLRKEFDRYIIRRINHPQAYEEFGIDLDTGFLLHGPPGCGKTLIAKVVANESGANFIHIKGPELLNKYVGESERAVREVFNQARICSPCILFFDEVDALTAKRGELTNHVGDRVLNQLLIELDGGDKRKGVFVIGATNRRDVMDPAVLRPGRFGKSMYVPLPDADGRTSILKALSRKKPVDASVNFHAIARMKACENLSGADLAALMSEAAMTAMEEKLINSSKSCSNSTTLTIKTTHFEQALPKILQSVSNR